LAGFSFFQDCDEEDAVAGMLSVYRAGTGFEGVDEYAPAHADNSLLAMGLPVACLSPTATTSLGQASVGGELEWSPDQGGCEKTFPAAADRHESAENLSVDADVPYGGYLILRLRRYPAWRVRVNGQLAAPQPERADGLIAVPIPQGKNHVAVDWTATEDTRMGRWLSALALVLLIGLWWTERKLAPARLS
jgi:hypothetical protein